MPKLLKLIRNTMKNGSGEHNDVWHRRKGDEKSPFLNFVFAYLKLNIHRHRRDLIEEPLIRKFLHS